MVGSGRGSARVPSARVGHPAPSAGTATPAGARDLEAAAGLGTAPSQGGTRQRALSHRYQESGTAAYGRSDHPTAPDTIEQDASPDVTSGTESGVAMTVAQRTSPAAAAAAVQAVVELFPGRDSAVISRGVAVAETNAAPVTLKAIVTDVLTWLGMRALVPDVPVPDLPVPSVIESFWLAVRDLQRKYNNQRPATRLTLFDQDPDGAIRGRLNATDFESDPISYTVTATPARGAVAVDADGDFVYTPGAQIAAGGGADSFTVTLDDGARHGLFGLTRQTTVKVAITVIPVGTQADPTQVSVVANVSLDGIQSGAPTFNADGTRALVTTYELNSGYTRQNWRVAMIDTIAGTQVGTPTALPGPWLSSMMSADGTRAVITAFDQDATGYTTWVETIDTATGTQIGAAFNLPGQASGTLLTPSGSRALFTTATYDSATGMNSTAAAVIDTATGAQVGPTITLPGLSSTIVSADGTPGRGRCRRPRRGRIHHARGGNRYRHRRPDRDHRHLRRLRLSAAAEPRRQQRIADHPHL